MLTPLNTSKRREEGRTFEATCSDSIIRIREIVSVGNVLRAHAVRSYKYIEEAFEDAEADGHRLPQGAALFCVALP